MAMASAGTGTGTTSVALLFAVSAVVFLLLLLQAQRPGLAVADLVASALDRVLDGRGLMELATRRNMVLLCHAILLLILRDAGVLGKAARRRRSRSPPGEAATATVAVVVAHTAAPFLPPPHAARSDVVAFAPTACSAVPIPVPARPHATRSAVVWRRRPRNRAAVGMHDATAAATARARRLVECQLAAEAAATWAAPVLTTGPAEEAGAVAVGTKQIVVAESPTPRNDGDDLLDRHDRAGVVVEPLAHPTAIAVYGERDNCDDDDRQIVAIADGDEKRTDDQTAVMETQTEMELADDRTFEEFIESQRRQMRQESLQLQLVSSAYHYQTVASCY